MHYILTACLFHGSSLASYQALSGRGPGYEARETV